MKKYIFVILSVSEGSHHYCIVDKREMSNWLDGKSINEMLKDEFELETEKAEK